MFIIRRKPKTAIPLNTEAPSVKLRSVRKTRCLRHKMPLTGGRELRERSKCSGTFPKFSTRKEDQKQAEERKLRTAYAVWEEVAKRTGLENGFEVRTASLVCLAGTNSSSRRGMGRAAAPKSARSKRRKVVTQETMMIVIIRLKLA